MQQRGVDYIIIRSTDKYLNEYVPHDLSEREWISGFTGSLGDALIGLKTAHLFVDGRYGLQATKEAPDYQVHVMPLGMTIESGWVSYLLENAKGKLLSLDDAKLSCSLCVAVSKRLKSGGVKVKFEACLLQTEVQQNGVVSGKSDFWKVPLQISGLDTHKKIKLIQRELKQSALNGFVVVKLDAIAWLLNLRSNEYPFLSVFSSRCAIVEGQILLGVNQPYFSKKFSSSICVVAEKDFVSAFKTLASKGSSIGYDPSNTPASLLKKLKQARCDFQACQDPAEKLKSIKNANELQHMKSGFHRADKVVNQTIRWTNKQTRAGLVLSEAEIAERLAKNYMLSGAKSLSFSSICGYGSNGAIIHYSKLSTRKNVKPGNLFLMDSGALYEGGYATDLTRTFFVKGAGTAPSKEHKAAFTTVLKGAIAGMTAKFPAGTTGKQIDAMVRMPIWAAGYTYAHGTGHGVGINVHEFPPSISTKVDTELKVGQVFSIEPGVYLEGKFGIRIENLCTVEEDKKHQGFLQIVPLTFSPLDKCLIERAMLTQQEKLFLKWYSSMF